MARIKLKHGSVISSLKWSILLCVFLVSLIIVNSQTVDEDLDKLVPLPDYIDIDPEDPNDATPCTYQREEYFHTERWVVDECSRCFCNNGTTNCVYESCPTLTCDFFDQVKIEGECCKKCPPEMVVSRTEMVLHTEEVIVEGTRQELKFDVSVQIQKQGTSRHVHGVKLWKTNAWISRSFDGSGNRLFFTENALTRTQQDSSFSKPNYPPWLFGNVTLALEGDKRGLCEDFTYLCVKFNVGDEPVTEFNLDFSFMAQNNDESRLQACTVLPDCKGVVISDFEWSIQEAGETRRQSSVDLDIAFQDDTRDLEGSGLWQASLFASSNARGTGERFNEIEQILNEQQSRKPIVDAENVRIRRIQADFDLGTIGCTPDTTHLCLELQKGPTTQPDYTLDFLDERGNHANVESVIKCSPRKCGAKAIFTELMPEITSPPVLIENTPAQTVVLDVEAITDKELSTLVEGDTLWQMNVFFSKKPNGFGRRIGERFQVLNSLKQTQTLGSGDDLDFSDVRFEVDLSRLVCEDIPYMCTELKKNPSASIDYEFGTKPEQDPFIGCLDMSDICRGVIARDLEWKAEFPNFLDSDRIEPIQSVETNSSVAVNSISRDINGRTMWQMSVFASSTDQAAPEDILTPYFSQVLTEEQAGLPVPEDGILRFQNMKTPPFQVDRLGCGKYRFFCYEFKKAEDPDVDFTFNEDDTGGNTVLNCQEMECQAVTPDVLDWTLEAEDLTPGMKTPVNLNVDLIFNDDTRDISGDALWRLGLFGSAAPNGSGPKFDEVHQILDDRRLSLPVVDQAPIEFGELLADFEIGTIGCTEGVDYVCLELTKHDSPQPDYIMLIEQDGSYGPESVVSCKQQECFSKAVFDDLTATFAEDDIIVEGEPDQLARVHLTGVTDKAKSTVVSGEDLWTMATFFSGSKVGRGMRLMERTQILDRDEISQPLTRGADLDFPEVEFPLDLTDVRCSSVPYVCFELKKNKLASINYKFKPDPEQEPLINCQSTEGLCKGVVGRFLSWAPDEDANGHVPGERSPIIGDVTVDVAPISRDLSGKDLWKLSIFASSDEDGVAKVGPVFDQVLSKSQRKTPLQDGGPIDFEGIVTQPYPIDQLGCGESKYLCLELRKSDEPIPEFDFETTEGEDVLKHCIEQTCDAVFLDELDWEMEFDMPVPGEKSPVSFDINARFDDMSREVNGEDLWQVNVFGSNNGDGAGERFSEDSRILTEEQGALPLDESLSIAFQNAQAAFDIGSIGCTEFDHVCVELTRGREPTTEFHFIVPSVEDELPTQTAISCKPKSCGSMVFFEDLVPEILVPEVFTEGKDNQRTEVNLTGITDKGRTTQVAGEDLWQANTFFSLNGDGSGERLLEHSQILDGDQASWALLDDQDWTAEALDFDVDLAGLTCDQIPYMCFELIKNPASSINYQFEGEALKCLDMSDRCKGVEFTELDFEVTLEEPVHVRQPMEIDAVVSANPYSRGVSGVDLWELEVYSSSDPEGEEPVVTYAEEVLDTPLPEGGPLSLSDIITDELDVNLLGCGIQEYLCVKLSRGPSEVPEYTLELPENADSIVTCKKQKCEVPRVDFVGQPAMKRLRSGYSGSTYTDCSFIESVIPLHREIRRTSRQKCDSIE